MSRRRLTLDDVARRPEAGMNIPGECRFSPDGRCLTYLWSANGSLVRSLWRHDLETGQRTEIAVPAPETTREGTISRGEQLDRERRRTTTLGVTSYAWATDAPEPTLLVPMNGHLFVAWGQETQTGVHELAGVRGARGPLLSPDGSMVSYTMDGDLYVVPVRGGDPRRLTHDAEPGVFNGLAEFIAAEELKRFEGAWWSADSRSLAFAHVDERGVPPFTILHQPGSEPAEELHHYPFPGGPNARVTLRVAAADGSGVLAVDLGMRDDDYLARVVADPAGGWLAAVLPRHQRSLRWYRIRTDGSSPHLWTEAGAPWINLDDDSRVVADGRILRSTERSGFRHLEVRAASGELERVLTAGEWVVTEVVGIAAARGEVLFIATRDGVLDRHLYAVALDTPRPIADPARLTVESGWHEVAGRADGESWIDTWSDLEHSPSLAVTNRDGSTTIIHGSLTSAPQAGLAPPELVDVVAADGRTRLNAATYRAAGRGTGPPPTVVWVYGGPRSQFVKNAWEMTVHGLRQYLAQSGANVLVVDSRATGFRGLDFESAVEGRMGWNEVADQAGALRQLADAGELDLARVGIVGGSYGGFMVVLAMALEAPLFSTGVAIAPVAEWSGYDTAYTERYLGLPGENPNGYRESSALTHAGNVRGDLLLIHGTADENVHIRHSQRLVDAFAAAGKEVELVTLPGQRHRVRGPAIRERERRTIAHLLSGLGLPLPEELRQSAQAADA